MTSPINIHDSGKKIYLLYGIYNIRVLGGWNVKVGNFSISLRNIKNGRIIESRRTNMRVQSYAFRQRAKRILIIDITEEGEYIIEFKNSTNLKVKKSNLILQYLWDSPIPNKNIEICIG